MFDGNILNELNSTNKLIDFAFAKLSFVVERSKIQVSQRKFSTCPVPRALLHFVIQGFDPLNYR